MTETVAAATPATPSRKLARRMRELAILGGLALFFVIAALGVRLLDRAAVQSAFKPVPLFPGLAANENKVVSISIETKDKSFNVARTQDGKWVLPGKDNFPADPNVVKSTVLALAETKLIEERTKLASWHKRLDLDLPSDKGTGTVITLKDEGGQLIGAVVVGKGVDGSNTTNERAAYVRRPTDDQTYVALGKLALKPKEADWIEKRFLEFDRTRIQEAALKPVKGTAYNVRRAKPEDDFTVLTPLPPGRQLRSEREGNGLGNALFSLTFDDVMKASELDFSKAGFAGFKTFNGLSLSFALIERSGDTWATVAATAEPLTAPPAVKPGETPPLTAKEEADAINQRAAGWAFKIPKFKAILMTAPLEDLLKSNEPPPDGPSVGRP